MASSDAHAGTIRAYLMHLIPFNECDTNTEGGFDLKQASSLRSADDDGNLNQTCGVQLAVLEPLKALRLWCKVEVLRGSEIVQTEVKELNPDSCNQVRHHDADIWMFDQQLSFKAAVGGLYKIRIFLSLSKDRFNESCCESFIYLEVPVEVVPQQELYSIRFSGGPIDGFETFAAWLVDKLLVPVLSTQELKDLEEPVHRTGTVEDVSAAGWCRAKAGAVYRFDGRDVKTSLQKVFYQFEREMSEDELAVLRNKSSPRSSRGKDLITNEIAVMDILLGRRGRKS